MTTSLIAQQVIWLDPFRPLTDPDRAQLAGAGLVVHTVATLDDVRDALDGADLLVVRLDGGTDLLSEVQALAAAASLAVPVVCRVERRDLELAVAAMRQGAWHVLVADEFSAPAWLAARAKPVAPAAAAQPAASPQAPRTVVYVDPASRHLLALAQRVAQAQVTVLIEGPTGAGKEVLARVVHESSPRARGPFVALNCAALPDHLIEDMLFGHEKGAFTGAVKEHRGLFEQAQGGTLFLDEIAEMPLHLQAKLLRVLQERQLTRLGGERALDLDVRVVAATNKDLRALMAQREFREDLYFRLSTFKLRVPTLAQRPGDIMPLVARLLARHAQGARVLSVDVQAQMALQAYAWPGNVRELENVIMRALVLCMDAVITPAHLMFDDHPAMPAALPAFPSLAPAAAQPFAEPTWTAPAASAISATAATAATSAAWAPAAMPAALASAEPAAPQAAPASLQAAVQSNEHQLIMAAIESTYSRMEAARQLGISPRTLRYKLAKLKGGHALGESSAVAGQTSAAL